MAFFNMYDDAKRAEAYAKLAEKPVKSGFMLHLSTASLKDLVKDYGPLFTAGATIIAATVASIAARAAMRSAKASERSVGTAKLSMEHANRAYVSIVSTKCLDPIAPGEIPCASWYSKTLARPRPESAA